VESHNRQIGRIREAKERQTERERREGRLFILRARAKVGPFSLVNLLYLNPDRTFSMWWMGIITDTIDLFY
jgi:hypothetical protein